ncbi:MAG: hypothetical protein VX899_14510 [Myxococcota bacterium]|nr:hypothetical protein [Myxococcota bacterium]
MYRCQNCGVLVAAGTKVNRIVVETRPRTYQADSAPKGRKKKKMKGRYQRSEALGWEIVRELAVCSACYAKLSEEMPEPVRGTPTIQIESDEDEGESSDSYYA